MAQTIEVLVGRIGRAHGLRGEVTVHTTTDSPEQRFAPGSQLYSTDPAATFTVRSRRWQAGTLVVGFDRAADRSAAEALRGTELWTRIEAAAEVGADEFPDAVLIGLAAVDPDGNPLGSVSRVLHFPAQDLLAITTADGERLVPFVTALVPEVDLAAGRLVIDPIPGLLDGGADED